MQLPLQCRTYHYCTYNSHYNARHIYHYCACNSHCNAGHTTTVHTTPTAMQDIPLLYMQLPLQCRTYHYCTCNSHCNAGHTTTVHATPATMQDIYTTTVHTTPTAMQDIPLLYMYLLLYRAVVLQWQNKRVRRGCEGVFTDCLNNIFEFYFWGKGVTVVDDGLSSVTIPTVKFHTPTTRVQHLGVGKGISIHFKWHWECTYNLKVENNVFVHAMTLKSQMWF